MGCDSSSRQSSAFLLPRSRPATVTFIFCLRLVRQSGVAVVLRSEPSNTCSLFSNPDSVPCSSPCRILTHGLVLGTLGVLHGIVLRICTAGHSFTVWGLRWNTRVFKVRYSIHIRAQGSAASLCRSLFARDPGLAPPKPVALVSQHKGC